MDAQSLLQAGDLSGALSEVQQQVKRQPAESRHRIFLFQVRCILGDWDRAMTQLGVLEGLAAENLPLVRTYSAAIQCERLRTDVFNASRSPIVFGEPQQWLALLLDSNRLLAEGNVTEAENVRAEALEAAPATSGTLNGQPFDWIMDADPRLGPVSEVILDGKYYWVPLNRIRKLTIEAPEDLRDLVWLPASFEWANGGELQGLIPARYPGSEASEDPSILLSRKTDWQNLSENTHLGSGQRLFATSEDDFALLDTREIVLDVSG